MLLSRAVILHDILPMACTTGKRRWCRRMIIPREEGCPSGRPEIYVQRPQPSLTTDYSPNVTGWDGWAVFFAGAEVIVLLGATVRLLIPEHRESAAGYLVCGPILLSFGLGDQIDGE